jgi:hypothetical protein
MDQKAKRPYQPPKLLGPFRTEAEAKAELRKARKDDKGGRR